VRREGEQKGTSRQSVLLNEYADGVLDLFADLSHQHARLDELACILARRAVHLCSAAHFLVHVFAHHLDVALLLAGRAIGVPIKLISEKGGQEEIEGRDYSFKYSWISPTGYLPSGNRSRTGTVGGLVCTGTLPTVIVNIRIKIKKEEKEKSM
jgi:hypothetical protein